MSEILSTLLVRIGADISGFTSGLQTVSSTLTQFGGSLTALTAPLAAFGATGIKTAASFETLMVQLKTFGGVAGKELEQVKQFVLKMGADTVFSAQDAGQALLDMLKSGMSLKDGMAGLPTVLQLATVGNMSLAESSGIVTAAMAQYGLQAKDAGRITNALAQGANASRADVKDLGQALQNVGPIAKQFGLSVEDSVAVLSVFANNGIMGAEAGTQLKSMLLNLSRPTDKVQGAFKELGISLYDDAGKMKNLNVFIKEMDKAMSKLPMKKQNELMQTLGGTYGILGLSALRASGGIDTMQKAMKAAPGAASVADASMGTFSRAVESLRGSLETLQITVLTPLMENILKPLVNTLIDITNKVSAWAAANPELASTITMILAGLTALGPILAVAGVALGAIGTVIGALVSPIGLVIAGVGALAVAFATNFGGIRDTLQPIITSIGDMIRSLFYGDKQFAGGGQDPLGQLGGKQFAGKEDPLGQITKSFTSSNAQGPIQEFIDKLKGIWTEVQGPLEQLRKWFVEDAMPPITKILETAKGLIEDWGKTLSGLWDIAAPALQKLWNWFTAEGLQAILTFISDKALPAFNDLLNAVKSIWEAVSPELLKMFEWFVNSGLPKIVEGWQNWYQSILELGDFLANLWEGILKPALEPMIQWFDENFGAIIAWIDEALSKLQKLSGMTIGGQTGANGQPTGGRSVGDVFKQGMNSAAPGIGSLIGGLLGFAEGGFTGNGGANQVAGVVHGGEYVVPRNGALVSSGGYNGPSMIHIIFKADNFEDHLYANIAEAMAE